MKKRAQSDTDDLEISTPRDRDSSFEPEQGLSGALLRPSARQELCSRRFVRTKSVSQDLTTRSSAFMPEIKPPRTL